MVVGGVLLSMLVGCDNDTKDLRESTSIVEVVVTNSAAHWLDGATIVVSPEGDASRFFLIAIDIDDNVLELPLVQVDMPEALAAKYPHLSAFPALSLAASETTIPSLLKAKLYVQQRRQDGELLAASSVQTYGVLDALYTAGANDADEISNYGATITDNGVDFVVWAPTATAVKVKLFNADKSPHATPELPMQWDSKTGVWRASGAADLAYQYYRYQVSVYHPAVDQFVTLETTDPWSLSLSRNSEYSQIVDLADSKTQPDGWASQIIAEVAAPEDLVLYEMHVRDFSAMDTQLANEAHRGKYLAFTEQDSDGIRHIKQLKNAGLNALHLLPIYDISTVNEDPSLVLSLARTLGDICVQKPAMELCRGDYDAQQSLREWLQTTDRRSDQAQAVIEVIRDSDDYNWGYDPFHYNVPEGSYAVNPEGVARIVEFRQMVKSVHDMGFRLIMDVVYNHTFASGLAEKSVLDKIVPTYYHRRDPISGAVEQSTCCDNTATEHAMMEKLMVDSLVVWARDYKIDGFRFDLMGHQPKDAMLRARQAVRTVDPDTYFYGEGWNFGEVANNRQFVQASQTELAGTEIGTFSDRLRDAVRGGGPGDYGDATRRNQGLGNGLYTAPNEMQTEEASQRTYLYSADLARLSLAGNLIDYQFEAATGEVVNGTQVSYGGGPAGYGKDPADMIQHVSKHDNTTLWDNNQFRIANDITADQRVRMHLLSHAYVFYAQGIPFMQMGTELLRSKSFLRDSYDYGDWFNAVDFAKQTNNYDVGLPPKVKDEDKWQIISQLLLANEGRDHVTAEQIRFASDAFANLISVRMSEPLFRLRTADEIMDRVSFLNAGANQRIGHIAMKLAGDDRTLVVVFNNSLQAITQPYEGAEQFALHPVLQNGVDAVVKQSVAGKQGFTVPPLTAAVFVK